MTPEDRAVIVAQDIVALWDLEVSDSDRRAVERRVAAAIRAAEEAARAEEREAIRLLLDTVDELLGDGLGRDPDFVDGAKVNAVENALAAIRARGQAAAGPCESPVNEEDVDGVQYCGRCRFASVAHRRGQP